MSEAGGTWAPLASGPPVGVNNCLLLSDGTVLGMNGAGQCVKLTPDIHGSYINGTWTSLPTMNYSRLFFSSDLLTNGNVYVAGGEYGPGGNYAELYDTLANAWTVIPSPSVHFSDACSKILPSGNVLQSDSQSGIYLYNTVSNIITGAGTIGTGDMNESCWVRMPNDNILAVNGYGQNSQHYVPSLNAWYSDNNVPVPVFGYGGELGAAFVLPNGKTFQIGATTNTAIYTPGGSLTSAGTWVAGPGMLFPLVTNTANSSQVYGGALGAVDAPAAMMVNGNILCALGDDSGFNGTSFYEYNYLSNNFTQVSAPYGSGPYGWDGNATFATSMLDLPDGSVLYIDGQNSGSLYIYTPTNAAPLAAGKPVINSITENLNGTYHLTGVGLNGISAGAAYGDDEQMDTSYPLVRLTNNVSGNVYYARTYQWSSTTVQNPNPVTTEFSVPANLPAGTYSLVVTANGNPSAPQTFTYAPPTAPTGLTGTAGNAQTTLSWNPVSGATSYNVKRLTTISPPQYAIVATVTATGCTNLGLVNGMDYIYAVSAVSAGGESTNSTPLLLVPFGPPPVPTGVTATAIPHTFADAPQINLAWIASYGATNYNIKRSTVHNGPYTNVAGPVNPFYADTNLLIGKTYYYVISAVSAGGESSNSVEISAATLLVTNLCLPVTAADVVGSQVTFITAFSGTNLTYQWRKIVGGVTNDVAGATNMTLTLANLQLTNTATYQLRASNALGVAVSTLGSLTVSSVPAAVNNVITTYAAQTGAGSIGTYTNFVPTWTESPDSLIFGQAPSSVGSGDFSSPGFETAGTVPVLTDGTFGWLNYWPNVGSSPTEVTCGTVAGGAGQSVTYTLTGSTTGYNLTNIVVYGGWGDAGRDQQAYTVYYSTVAAPTNFIQLSVVNYNPANPSAVQSATRATLTPVNGVLATNVAAVMFDFTTPAGENGFEGYSEIEVFGSVPPPLPVAPYLVTNTLPVTAADVVGSQVTFMAAFSGTNPIACQWQKVSGGVTNNISGATNTILTLTNLQLSDTASYQLRASNILGVAVSTPSSLTVSSVPAAVNNVVTSMAAQTGLGGAPSYVPTWMVATGSLIFGQPPNSVGSGNFNQAGGTVTVLTDGSFGTLDSVPGNGSSPTEVTCGGTAGQSVIYTLAGSGSGYNLTNITVYGGWGDAGRDQQAYTVYYSKIAAPTTFIQLGVVNYNPANPAGSLSGTRATLTPANGALATNVAALKFDFTTPAPENGYCGYSEISVFGSATPVAPLIVLTAPANNAVFNAANPINLAATVTTNNNIINFVKFFFNSTNLIGQVTNTPYTYAWNNVSAGSYSVAAQLIYNNSSSLTSTLANITVTNPPPPSAPTGLGATTTNTQVNLSWMASAGATSYNVKSSTTNGGTYTIITNLAGTSYTNAGLVGGVTYYYVVSALNLGGESANSLQVSATPEALPPPWVTGDIGSVGLPGIASYSNGVFTVTGSGTDIADTADAFRYVYQPVNGNCDIRARVAGVQNTSAGAKAGVMLRETLANNSANAMMDATLGNGLEFIWRASAGGSSSVTGVANLSAPYWVRLVRNKNTFTAYRSPNGTTWTKVGTSQTIPMATNIYAGLAVCAQNNAALCTATFDNVTLPAPPSDVYTAPQLTVGGQTSGAFTFQFQGASDLNYIVETSTNLTDWTAIFTNALTDADGGIFTFTNSAATDAARFYRVSQ